MINPVNHASSREDAAVYKVEPYVIAADVYAVAPHVGRGGWSWYTGSAGWMYRLIAESLLGLTREADRLRFDPCLPPYWPSVSIDYRYLNTLYRITIEQTRSANFLTAVTLDGAALEDAALRLVDDGEEHQVRVVARIADVDARSMAPHAPNSMIDTEGS